MSKALSLDLRIRVLAAVAGGDDAPRSGRAFRGQRRERQPLADTRA